MNKADFQDGDCFICLEKNIPVRLHGNFYTVGSEGTVLCENCEKVIREIMRIMRSSNIHKEINTKKVKK